MGSSLRTQDISIVRGTKPTGNVLVARFFRIGGLEKLLDVPKKIDAWKEYARDVLPLFGINCSEITSSPEHEVHVHIRSGDNFELDGPHPGYGQPPLSFYKKALIETADSEVVLVFENYSNPVIRPLVRWLMLRGRKFRIQSDSVHADQTELFRARHIVASKGTFLYPVFLASRNIQSVTLFDNRVPRVVLQESIAVKKVLDVTGEYQEKVLATWTNSKQQRQMMIRYPKRKLRIEE